MDGGTTYGLRQFTTATALQRVSNWWVELHNKIKALKDDMRGIEDRLSTHIQGISVSINRAIDKCEEVTVALLKNHEMCRETQEKANVV